jgi:hypothetical protein
MKVSRWIRPFAVLGLLVCTGCPTPEGYVIGPKPPRGFHYVLLDDARLRKLNLDPVSEEDADDEDRTGFVITGGADFGTPTGGMVPVTLTTIKIDATGETGYAMQSLEVWAGSGYIPGSPSAGTLVTDLPNSGGSLNPTLVTIASFENPAPDYDPGDQTYWIWVVVQGTKNGVAAPVNGQLQLELIADTWGAAFHEY